MRTAGIWATAAVTISIAILGTQRAQTAAPAQAAQTSSRFYTAQQATRGRTAFNKYCALCHTVDSTTVPAQIESGRGIRVGSTRAVMGLGGNYLKRVFEGHPDYPSVYYLFNRIRESMPAFGADTVGLDTKTDIVAFLLQENGLPPGDTELTHDVAAMKRMRLTPAASGPPSNDQGFEPVFNGRDFTNFGFLLGPNCRPAPIGCGKTGPGALFRVENGVVVNTGKIQGYMYTQKKYLNFTLRFDYRFVAPADWTDEDGVVFYGNSGYFLFVTEHQVWPKGIQIEGYHRRPLIPFAMDTKVKFTEETGATARAMRALGEWNSVEIVSKDGQVRSSLNGVLLYTITEHEFKAPGHIAFESEGSEIHWRNIRIKVE